MKKFFLAFVCIVGMTIVTHAQNGTPTKEDPEAQKAKQLEQIASACKTAGLTDEEIGKVKTIITAFRQKQVDINKDTTIVGEEKKTKLKEANSEKDWKIQYLMGKERYKLYADARKKLIAEEAAAKQTQ